MYLRKNFKNTAIVLTILIPMLGLWFAGSDIYHHRVTGVDIGLFFFFYLLGVLSISIGLHRLFSHRAFEAAAPLKCLLAAVASACWQGNLFSWAAEHRVHHATSDEKGDFHSPYVRQDGTPIHGFWHQFAHSHFMWFFRRVNKAKYHLVRDLMKDPQLVFIDKHYFFWSLLSLVFPALCGWALYAGNPIGLWKGFVWGGLLRICVVHHVTWCINSVSHLFGRQVYETGDNSRNVLWYAILAVGEGYHNNHHAFPRSACFGMDKGQWFDLSWYVIRLLEKLGWVRNVVYPPKNRSRKLISKAEESNESVRL